MQARGLEEDLAGGELAVENDTVTLDLRPGAGGELRADLVKRMVPDGPVLGFKVVEQLLEMGPSRSTRSERWLTLVFNPSRAPERAEGPYEAVAEALTFAGRAGADLATVIASQRIEYARQLGHRRDDGVLRDQRGDAGPDAERRGPSFPPGAPSPAAALRDKPPGGGGAAPPGLDPHPHQ